MANYHNDNWINEKVQEHYKEALEYFPEDRIVGIFYQGSGNYGMDYEKSDVDTKLIITPTFEELAFNKKPVSTTHIRYNEEHIDFKDVRLYIETFRKQNLNFLEILFTKYKYINPLYEKYWKILENNKEEVAHYDVHRMLKSMRGIALEKYHAMEHRYPSKVDIIDKYGYDGKQLSHLLRIENFLDRYIKGENFETCLIPNINVKDMIELKKNNGTYKLEQAREIAKRSLKHIDIIYENAITQYKKGYNKHVDMLLNDIQYNIMKIAVLGG